MIATMILLIRTDLSTFIWGEYFIQGGVVAEIHVCTVCFHFL